MTRPLQRWLPASLAAYAQGVCAVTFLFAIFATPWSYRVALIADILLVVELALAVIVSAKAADKATGTRRALCIAIAIAASFALLGRLSWTLAAMQAGVAPVRPLVEATTG